MRIWDKNEATSTNAQTPLISFQQVLKSYFLSKLFKKMKPIQSYQRNVMQL